MSSIITDGVKNMSATQKQSTEAVIVPASQQLMSN